MDIKKKLAPAIATAGKAAKTLYDTTVSAIDQNDDGKFDMKDVSVIKDAIKKEAEQRALQRERDTLRPIFESDLTNADFFLPKFIRITEREKKYIDSSVCEGAIGFTPSYKSLNSITVFQDCVDAFGLTFYPDRESEFYYVDPCDRDRYIALNEYFNYMQTARVGELLKISQALGAKHFRVTFKEEQATFSKQKTDVREKVSGIAGAEFSRDSAEERFSRMHIEAEMSFPGQAPQEPQLKYLQRDPNIESLISMRMNETSPLQHQRLLLKLSNTSGMKEADAVKIDSVLNELKVSGNASVESEVKNEARRYLEYEIDF